VTGPLLVGVDVGTAGARALAVDAAGEPVAEAQATYELSRPAPGWTEQRPQDWWAATREVLREVAAAVEGDIAGVGLSGQMHGSVFLDAAGEVLRPALLWNDQRTVDQAAALADRVGEQRLVQITGNPALTGFQAPKILWLRDEEPERYERLDSILLPKDYVRLMLTGERATDASDASGTLLLDARARTWSREVLEALEIPAAWLPEVHEGPEVTGALRASVAAELGLPEGVPVAAGGGDNAAAAVGVAISREGRVSASLGTSGVVFAHRDAFTPDPSLRVHACCHALPGAYHLMGVTLAAGGALDWWRSVAGAGESFDALVAEAAGAPAGAEGLLFAPYLSGERTPHRDPHARAAFLGLSARHERAHLTRAVLEGVVFSLRDGLEAMRELGDDPEEIRATGGGARSALWRQIQADVLGAPVRRTVVDQGPAYGAALLAGLAAGVYAEPAEAEAVVRLRDEAAEPDADRARRYEELYASYRALYPATREIMHGLARGEA
jgi:xylulokinase